MNTPYTSYSKLYFTGLAPPFHEDLSTNLHTIMDGAQNTTLEDLYDQPKELAKDAGKEILKGKNWYEVLKDTTKKLLKPAEWRNLVTDIGTDIAKKVSIEATPGTGRRRKYSLILSTISSRLTEARASQRISSWYAPQKRRSLNNPAIAYVPANYQAR